MCLTGNAKLIHCATVPPVPDVAAIGRGERFAPPAGSDIVRAWRVWTLEGSTLRSRTASATWTPGEPMRAHQAVKADRAAVGVHAVLSQKELPQVGLGDRTDRKLVVGEIALWGDVAEHDNGYRAEFGYPLRLWTNSFLATAKLRDAYGVAVEIQPARDLLAASTGR